MSRRLLLLTMLALGYVLLLGLVHRMLLLLMIASLVSLCCSDNSLTRTRYLVVSVAANFTTPTVGCRH